MSSAGNIGLIVIIVIVVSLGAAGAVYFSRVSNQSAALVQSSAVNAHPSDSPNQNNQDQSPKVLAENLDTPWAMAFLPDGSLLATERAGRVRIISKEGQLDPSLVATLNQVKEIGEGGLLGIAVDPNFAKNHFVYFYYTYSTDKDNSLNRVVKMTYADQKLTNEQVVVDAIPGSSNHNGGRIKFGPDNLLYIGTGDAEEPSQAQNINSLAGKILRVNKEGKAEVYSYGHRNVQGLAWDKSGNLWATEHGRSGIQSGLDEINLIQQGKNYGWPVIQGNETKSGMETAVRNSGNTTWAPSGAVFVGDSLFFTGLRGQTLYQAVIENNSVKEIKEHFKSQYGRIREVILGPDGMLYITTSNKDGRGNPDSSDDKVLRLNPAVL